MSQPMSKPLVDQTQTDAATTLSSSLTLARLVYTSKSSLDCTDSEMDLQIEAIIRVARRHNPSSGVTGVLLFTRSRFAQVLEGDEATVTKLYQRIFNDSRHTSIRLIALESITERTFGSWSMGYIGADTVAAAKYSALVEATDDNQGDIGSDQVVEIIADHLLDEPSGD